MVKVTNLLPWEQNPGLQLSLTLTQQKIKVVNPTITNSWQMITFTDISTAYAIDQIKAGLSFDFPCNLPCLTCKADDPDYCLSCN